MLSPTRLAAVLAATAAILAACTMKRAEPEATAESVDKSENYEPQPTVAMSQPVQDRDATESIGDKGRAAPRSGSKHEAKKAGNSQDRLYPPATGYTYAAPEAAISEPERKPKDASAVPVMESSPISASSAPTPTSPAGAGALAQKQEKLASYRSLSKESAAHSYGGLANQAMPSELAANVGPRHGPAPKAAYRQDSEGDDSRCARCYPDQDQYEAPPAPNSEEYAAIYENSFMDSKANPLSTFSIDVDGASYSNTRRFIQEGQLPPADAVRLEEFVNYFEYDYPQPTGSDPFSITTEVATTPWNPETKLVHIGLQGRRMETEKLPPNNLVFLIDVSGSMDSPEKLPLLKDGFQMLIDQMRPQDRISIVVYAGAAGMVLPPTSGSDKHAIREAIDRLQAGGSTAGGAGIMLAYQAAQQTFIKGGSNRVILATDGDFNVGISNDADLVKLIEDKRKSGVFLSVLGFGTGNYKDAKMEQIADKGNGNYFYIDNINEARKVLVEKMAGTLFAIAKDVKLQIEFNPAAVKSYRLVGYENRLLAAEDFNDDRKDAGELGAGTNVTALYEIVPAAPSRPAVDPLKYQGNGGKRWSWNLGGSSNESELLTVKFRYKQPQGITSKLLSRTLKNKDAAWQDATENFRFSAAAAGFGMVLRGSRWQGNLDFDKVAGMARGARGRDTQGHRAEFVTLVNQAKALAGNGRVGWRNNQGE